MDNEADKELPRSLLEVLVQDEVALDELHLRLRVRRAVLLPKIALPVPRVEALHANNERRRVSC